MCHHYPAFQRHHYVFHSCNHRACPRCGAAEQAQWTRRQEGRLLPVPYYLLTLTAPAEMRDVVVKWKLRAEPLPAKPKQALCLKPRPGDDYLFRQEETEQKDHPTGDPEISIANMANSPKAGDPEARRIAEELVKMHTMAQSVARTTRRHTSMPPSFMSLLQPTRDILEPEAGRTRTPDRDFWGKMRISSVSSVPFP